MPSTPINMAHVNLPRDSVTCSTIYVKEKGFGIGDITPQQPCQNMHANTEAGGANASGRWNNSSTCFCSDVGGLLESLAGYCNKSAPAYSEEPLYNSPSTFAVSISDVEPTHYWFHMRPFTMLGWSRQGLVNISELAEGVVSRDELLHVWDLSAFRHIGHVDSHEVASEWRTDVRHQLPSHDYVRSNASHTCDETALPLKNAAPRL